MPKLMNFVLFQLGWLVCVYAGSINSNLLALSYTSAFVVLHLLLSNSRRTDLRLMVAALLVGLLLDSFWPAMGWLQFNGHLAEQTAPLWILCLWLNFALTLNHSLAWMQSRLALAAACSAVGAPLSYWAGERFGALIWLDAQPLLIALAASWALVVPLLLLSAGRWHQQEQEAKHAVA